MKIELPTDGGAIIDAAAGGGGAGGAGVTGPTIVYEDAPITFEHHRSGEFKGLVVGRLSCKRNRNALSYAMLKAINDALDRLHADRGVRVLIIKSELPGVFCAGADLKERRVMSEEEVPVFVSNLRSLMTKLAELPIPIIAAIDGVAFGGGLELALACDLRICSRSSLMGLVETQLGIIPGAGGTQRLSRIVGIAKAKEMIFTAAKMTGDEAARIGLVNHVVDTDPYMKAVDLAREILKAGPIAIRAAKIAIDRGFDNDMKSALMHEQQGYQQVVATKDRIEGMEAFIEKRTPIYIGE